MLRKIGLFAVSVFALVNIYGCVALLAGAAGGAGTAAWLSNKLVQETNVSFERAIKASKAALKSMKLEVTKETVQDDVAQIKSSYLDGKTIWIDIHKTSSSTSRIEVRVGITGDEAAARKVMDNILRYL